MCQVVSGILNPSVSLENYRKVPTPTVVLFVQVFCVRNAECIPHNFNINLQYALKPSPQPVLHFVARNRKKKSKFIAKFTLP